MTDKKKLTDEERALIAAESAAKIEAAKARQAEALAYGERVRKMPRAEKIRELRRIEKEGGLLDAALAIALRVVFTNTRIRKDEAFEIVKGKQIFHPEWINEEGTVGSYLR